MVQRHGALAVIFSVAVIAVIFVLRRPGGERRAIKPLLCTLGFLALQGGVGLFQWFTKLPSGLVWVHVTLAVGTWLTVLWAVGAAGLLESEPNWQQRDPQGENTAG